MASRASIFLQILIYFERIYAALFFIFELILYIFKANVLVYPPGYLGSEIVGIFFLLILQYVKLNNANTANKTELRHYHVYTIFFSLPVISGYIFYLIWQVYVLYFDLALSFLGLVISFLEMIFSIYVVFTLKSDR